MRRFGSSYTSSSGGWNPEGRTTKLDTSLRRYDFSLSEWELLRKLVEDLPVDNLATT